MSDEFVNEVLLLSMGRFMDFGKAYRSAIASYKEKFLSGRTPVSCVPGRAATWRRGFVNCFLRVPQLYWSCACCPGRHGELLFTKPLLQITLFLVHICTTAKLTLLFRPARYPNHHANVIYFTLNLHLQLHLNLFFFNDMISLVLLLPWYSCSVHMY